MLAIKAQHWGWSEDSLGPLLAWSMAAESHFPDRMAEKASERIPPFVWSLVLSSLGRSLQRQRKAAKRFILPSPSGSHSFVITPLPFPTSQLHSLFGVSLRSLYWPGFSAAGSQAQVPSLVSFFPLKRLLYPSLTLGS